MAVVATLSKSCELDYILALDRPRATKDAAPHSVGASALTGNGYLTPARPSYILWLAQDILMGMKHLVDVDETLLEQARATLGTSTIKDTVNEALRLAAARKRAELDAAMDELAELVRTLPVQDRANAW